MSVFILSTMTGAVYMSSDSGTSYKKAPNFILKQLNNKSYQLNDHMGKGPIIVNFWATWCAPCLSEMSEFKPLYDDYNEKGLEMLSISVDPMSKKSKIKRLVKRYKFPYKILLDPAKNVYNKFQVKNVPQIFVMDESGHIIYEHVGYNKKSVQEVTDIIKNLLPMKSNEDKNSEN